MMIPGNKHPVKLDRKLRKELEDTLNQEELVWFQRSREEWIESRGPKYKILPRGYSYKKSQESYQGFD